MEILRYTAFSSDPSGGNPAGVVLDASEASAREMLSVAARLGYSETAFLVPRGDRQFDTRYFSPLAEVPFCGHASIAASVAFAERGGPGPLTLHTPAGEIPVQTSLLDGRIAATLTSVAPRTADIAGPELSALLDALRWDKADLDATLPPRLAFAGAWHPIIAAGSRERLAKLGYDFTALAELMAANEWTTVDLVYRRADDVFDARNPFPPGGVVEDPATGAAAAAFGGYLREIGAVRAPASITVHQGEDLGRPGVLSVDIPASGGIRVSGTAVALR